MAGTLTLTHPCPDPSPSPSPTPSPTPTPNRAEAIGRWLDGDEECMVDAEEQARAQAGPF